MPIEQESDIEPKRFHIPWTVGFCLFLAVALFLLWGEHKAHILGAAPFALLLCPAIHLFMNREHGIMHRGHGDHGGDRSRSRSHAHNTRKETANEP